MTYSRSNLTVDTFGNTIIGDVPYKTIASNQLINSCHSIFKQKPDQWKQLCNCVDGIVNTTRNSISCNITNAQNYKTKSTVGIMIEDYYHGK